MDNYLFTNYFDDSILNSEHFDLFGNNLNSGDNSNQDDYAQQSHVNSFNSKNNGTQSVNSQIFHDISETTCNYNKNGVSNEIQLFCPPSNSAEMLKNHKESSYGSNELFSMNFETTECLRNKSLEEQQSNLCKEQMKRMKKIERKLNLIKGKKSAHCERKLAHATAESRYRSSINEQIKKLKTLVAGPNANWKKSAILETVADYIQQLKTANSKLIEENLQLKMKLTQNSSVNQSVNTSYIVVPAVTSIPSNYLQPQYSTIMYSYI